MNAPVVPGRLFRNITSGHKMMALERCANLSFWKFWNYDTNRDQTDKEDDVAPWDAKVVKKTAYAWLYSDGSVLPMSGKPEHQNMVGVNGKGSIVIGTAAFSITVVEGKFAE